MALRPPCLQKTYDEFYSGDPAFEIPEPGATDEQRGEYARRVTVARETNGWAALLKPGGNPTKFVMRPIPGDVFRRVVDAFQAGKFGSLTAQHICFRAAIVSVVNLDDGTDEKIVPVSLDGIGQVASPQIANRLDALDPTIVAELGDEAFRRAQALAPKS